jgi:ubiquinone/menaquinone biosynthesis C-methylase UbiE
VAAFSPDIPVAASVYQAYLQGLKLHWKDALYARVVADARQQPVDDPGALEQALVQRSAAYRMYGWIERYLQQFKYLGRHGMLPVMESQGRTLAAALDAAARQHPDRLLLDPSLQLPAYFTASDFHQHPGGIWSDDVDAFAYEWAVNAFSFSMAAADAPYRWLAKYAVDRFAPASVVDLGCGFGKLCIPLKRLDPRMRITGIDLSAPLLRLAHLRSLEAGLDIRWLQANAEAVPLPDGDADGIVSYWLLHELPPAAIGNVVRESFRLLRPGGFLAWLDMYTAPGGALGKFLHLGHAARNNEPFLPGLLAMDLRQGLAAAGFTDIELVETLTGAPVPHDGSDLAATRTHTFTVYVARKPH